MNTPKAPIVLHISLSKYTKYLLEKLCGISTSENSRKRICWMLVLEIMNNYLKENQSPNIIPKLDTKTGSSRKIIIHYEAYPKLHSYMEGLMKSQRTFKFNCLLYSLEDSIVDIISSNTKGDMDVASEPSASAPRNQSIEDVEAPMSTEDSLTEENIKSKESIEETDIDDSDIDEFLDFMDF